MKKDNRTLRYKGRQALREITSDLRCFDCGYATVGDAVAVRRNAEGVSGFAGLASCGRIWLCPVCNAKVMARRALEIGVAVSWAQAQGFQLIWGALTVRHNAFSDLHALLSLQRKAWRRVIESKMWRKSSATTTVDHLHGPSCVSDCERSRDILLTDSVGRVGYIRAAELNIGRNGWHPHWHPLIIFRGTPEEAQAFADRVVAQWVHAVEHYGGEARELGGQLLHVLEDVEIFDAVTGYMVKATYDSSHIALELAWAQNKTGHAGKPEKAKAGKSRVVGTAAHWSLLVDIERAFDVNSPIDSPDSFAALERWGQLEDAIPGHRMIAWSRGLRAFAGVGIEKTDEDVAGEEVGTKDDDLCYITPAGWRGIRGNPELLGLILSTVEADGFAGLRIILDSNRVEYFTLITTE